MTKALMVEILTHDARGMTVMPISAMNDCQRCKEGNGCGNFPWFKGLNSPIATLQLPPQKEPWQCGELAHLVMTPWAANMLAFITYGLPLLALLLALLVTQTLPEGWQIIWAASAMGGTILATHSAQKKLLQQFVSLQPLDHQAAPRLMPSRVA